MAREMAVEIAVTPPLQSGPSPAPRRMRSESKKCSSSEGSHCSRFLFAAVEGFEAKKKRFCRFFDGVERAWNVSYQR